MTSFLRILPGMLAVGMLTGKAVGHHLPTLMPAVTPLLTGSGCLSFGSCFCFTPSCGGTKHKLFQSFIKVSLSYSLWFGHLSFVCLRKPAGLYWACFLWAWAFPVSLGWAWSPATEEGKGSIPGIWPYFITACFGMAQSSFLLLLWLFIIAGRKYLLSVRKFLYYLLVLKRYPRCH